MPAQEAASEINRFLREANVPYRFEQDSGVRVESDYIHVEVIRPALDALGRAGFEEAMQEFEQALEHARNLNTMEAATKAPKALESTINCICAERKETYPQNATATRANAEGEVVSSAGVPAQPNLVVEHLLLQHRSDGVVRRSRRCRECWVSRRRHRRRQPRGGRLH